MHNLSSEKLEIARIIESKQEMCWKISDAIWSYAELGLEEYRSSKLLADTLEGAGFTVDRGVAGMPTAFVATFSHGTARPVIGFLAEYDALPMLSQKAGHVKHNPVVPGAPGHGCGHNTMAAMQLLAVISLQQVMLKEGLNGTLKFFGSPAEEMLVSRPYMVRAGLFKDVEAVIDCHAWDEFSVAYGMEGAGLYSFVVHFKGQTAHSGSTPWKGRSATDAVELMHAGTERMREHLPVTHRIHWITLEGGEAPNVVPDRASTWYFIRDLDENLEGNYRWVMDCAKGAALMTQTTWDVKFLTAIHQRFGNKALAELIYENIKAIGKPKYTEQEEAFAKEMQEQNGYPVKGLEYEMKLGSPESRPFRAGSSDVGDVTLIAPTATIRYPAKVPGSPSHHWTVTSSARTSFAHKGITAGAKVAVFTAYDLMTRPELLTKIRAEFETLKKERPYRSFLPEDASPPIGWNTELMEKYRNKMEPFYLEP
ncbi:MAG: amidohydrolase [Deltaproteobacteria bacterium]|nr:amidohydrolase [Deltaproteobacteria bacterium]